MEFEKLKAIIVEVLNVDENEVSMESTFIDDLGADSLDVFQIIMGIEEEFDIEIPNEEAEKIVTVGDAVEAKRLYGKVIYFHNLKFDGTFILDWLLNNGYEYKDDLSKVDKGFNALIGDMGQFYSITFKFTKNKQIHFGKDRVFKEKVYGQS